ncbi:MAG: hypothetical protein AAGD88_08055 [Bacteroidota bacterium]
MAKDLNQFVSWKGYQKIGFRFALIFFVLFIILLDWSANPILSHWYYYGNLATLLDDIVHWVGKSVFQIPYVIVSPYDGEHNDRTYVYVLYAIIILMAALGTLVWSGLDRKRQDYRVLYYWLTVILRYYLAFTMFLFALYKFFKLQFPDLGYYTLTEQVGDMSPMHLAWAFFGYSYGYNVFMGLAESAALLLLFRRTTTFGAMLTLAALANVMVVNFSFEVHAKMYPVALFVMALFLLLKDAKRILQFFFTGQSIALPVITAPIFQKRWIRISKSVLKILVIGYFLIVHVGSAIAYQNGTNDALRAKYEYSGLYDVETFVLNRDTLSVDNPQRWQQFIIGDRLFEAVRLSGDSIAFLKVSVAKKAMLVYGNPRDLAIKRQEIYNEYGMTDDTWMKMDSILVSRQIVSRLHLKFSNPSALYLTGILKNDSVLIRAKKRALDIDDFRLMKRRFHWINEASYFY